MAIVRLQQRRGSSIQWIAGDFNGDPIVLASGEIGLETNTGKFKIGDGETEWSNLPYENIGNLNPISPLAKNINSSTKQLDLSIIVGEGGVQGYSSNLNTIANLTNTAGFLQNNGIGGFSYNPNVLVTSNIGVSVQAYNANLGTIAALGAGATTGILRKTGLNTWSLTSTYIASITGNNGISASTNLGATTLGLSSAYGDTVNPYGSKAINLVLASPASGSAAAPSFRKIVPGDFSSQTQKTFLAAPNDANGTPLFRTILPSDFSSQTQKTVLAAPNNADGIPLFRTLVASDLPSGPVEAVTTTAANGFGYIGMPQNPTTTGAYTIVAGDAGEHIYSTTTRTVTIPSNASVPFAIGTTIVFISGPSATTTISITSDTMYLAGVGTTGARTLIPHGMATAVKVASTTWYISGNGLT